MSIIAWIVLGRTRRRPGDQARPPTSQKQLVSQDKPLR
jgi:hypothetical protein